MRQISQSLTDHNHLTTTSTTNLHGMHWSQRKAVGLMTHHLWDFKQTGCLSFSPGWIFSGFTTYPFNVMVNIFWNFVNPGLLRSITFYHLLWDVQPQHPEMALGIVIHKRQKSTCNNESTLALKPMGRVIPSPKQRVPLPHKIDLGST